MSAVTISDAWPGFGAPFTVAELDRIPSDGHRYELLNGALIVSPWPTTVHQAVAARLAGALHRVCSEELCVVGGPAVQLDSATEFVPDLVVVRLSEVGDAKFTKPPLLVIEIRSPGTAPIDLSQKKVAYAKFGVPAYWILDTEPAAPKLTVFELRDGSYLAEASSTQPVNVRHPFTATIAPAELFKGLIIS